MISARLKGAGFSPDSNGRAFFLAAQQAAVPHPPSRLIESVFD